MLVRHCFCRLSRALCDYVWPCPSALRMCLPVGSPGAVRVTRGPWYHREGVAGSECVCRGVAGSECVHVYPQ